MPIRPTDPAWWPPPDGADPWPSPAIPAAPRRRTRWWLHGLLFVLTLATATMAGALTWNPEIQDPEQLRTLWAWLQAGLPYGGWVLAIMGAHEMGHYLACRYYRIPATPPYFIPGPPVLIGTFGAVIRIRGIIPHRNALFDVAAAGPLAGFAVALPVFVAGILQLQPAPAPPGEGEALYLGSPVLLWVLERWWFGDAQLQANPWFGAGWVGMLVTSLNLFPVGQLDGGHIAYALSRTLHRKLAWLTLAALGGLVLYQSVEVSFPPAYLLWFVILFLMRDRHPRLLDEVTPLSPGRRRLAFWLAWIFVLSFIPVPFAFG